MFKAEREVFLKALEVDPGAEREAFVRRACVGNELLRERVEALLEAEAGAGGFLGGTQGDAAGDGWVGRRIGAYRVMGRLGEGGYGVVYRAEQEVPVRRQVALKVVKPGMDTGRVMARFQMERQAVALMDHPCIARILDAGATEGGRPYFVMELVTGEPITRFCDRERMDVPSRLRLFLRVCSAVQHAHQKGIIHRDLKPSNVLVSVPEAGDTALPKVIDFGIAKALAPDTGGASGATCAWELLGTPPYMSPEQARGGGDAVDTRADIYALGVLLHELLVGRTPFEGDGASLETVRHRVLEEDVVRPSLRVRGMLEDEAGIIAERRATTPAKLGQRLCGDLDWIVLKCLEKEPARRYDSVGALSDDVRRHLEDQPVSAAAPGWGYRWRKALWRHRVAVAAGATGLAVLAGALVAIGAFAIRAHRAEGLAREEAAVAAAVTRFLNEDLFDPGSLEPAPEGALTLPVLLERAARQAEGRFADQPAVEAALRGTLGRAFYNLGRYAAAENQWRRAVELHRGILGEDHERTLLARSDLAQAWVGMDRRREARDLGEAVVARAREVLRPGHPLTLKFLSRLAVLCYHTADPARAREVASEVVAAGRRHPEMDAEDLALALDILGRMMARAGDVAGGERHVREAFTRTHEHFGPDHPNTLVAGNRLAGYLYNVGIKTAEAEQIYLDTLERQRRAFGERHPVTRRVRGNLALLYALREPVRPALALTQLLTVLEHVERAAEGEGLHQRLEALLRDTPAAAFGEPGALEMKAWRWTAGRPGEGWAGRESRESGWVAGEPPGGEVWLRAQAWCRGARSGRWMYVVEGAEDFELLVNGIPAGRPLAGAGTFHAGWLDERAAQTLQAGEQVVAARVRIAPGARVSVRITELPPG